MMQMLTADNYFSIENQMSYMSASQIRAFKECESAALAMVKGEYTPEKTTAQLVGSYVDAYFTGDLSKFVDETPELFTKSGNLKSEYLYAEYIIKRIERSDMFMRYVSGEKQVIMTAELEGIPFKIKVDSYHPGKAIVDLKILKDMSPVWVEEYGKMNFVEAWGYDVQGAIYQAVERNGLPFILAVATKEKPEPDIELISIPQDRLDAVLSNTMDSAKRYQAIKEGAIEPVRCEKCPYCRATKELTQLTDYRAFSLF